MYTMENKQAYSKIRKSRQRFLCLLMIFCLLSLCTACSNRDKDERVTVARYGNMGRSLALKLVETVPFRKAGSAGEKQAADIICEQLDRFKLAYERQAFSFRDASGQNRQSENIVVSIPGKGFQPAETKASDPMANSSNIVRLSQPDDAWILVGAHYDSYYSREEAENMDAQATMAQVDEDGNPIQAKADLPQMINVDGLDDNAAAVATLLTLCNTLRSEAPAFNVKIVFFGAGHANFAGAAHYLQELSDAEFNQLYCMLNLESIYAGDKVYAHAGQNSAHPGNEKDYLLRQNLYVCTDVYYNNLLLTNNGFALYTNQMGCEKELPGKGPCVYREWTVRESDHTVFDKRGISVVFFESADYDLEDCDLPFRQSSDPYFAASEGLISGTAFDSSRLLTNYYVAAGQLYNEDYFGNSEEATSETDDEKADYVQLTDPLEIRINNLAFLLSEFSRTAPYGLEIKN